MERTSAPAEAGADAPVDLHEHVVESTVIHRGSYLSLREDVVERADGTRARREVVGHPGAVAIVALADDGHVLLVRQFRLPASRVMLEIPAGTLAVDPGSGETEDPLAAAERELEEETGYRAGSWELLTSFWTAPGFATELMHLYLARDLVAAVEDRRAPEDDERLTVDSTPWQEALAAVEQGEIADAKSILALLWLARLKAAGHA